MPSEDDLAHKAVRALQIFKKFPYTEWKQLDGLGTFSLATDEKFAGDPTTS
jgi:hypothetical protein